MAEIVVTVALEVSECLLAPIACRLSLRKYYGNFENLKLEVEKLTDARDSMQNKIVNARRKGGGD